jgi:4a-hydroxytetrahydrobiopterin dehydratase
VSEEGWKAFVTADGIDDWVVLSGGPTAVFRVASFAAGAVLASAIAERVPSLAGTRAAITLTADQLTVRLTRGVFWVEPEHLDVAREISAVAKECSAVADRAAAQEITVAVAAKPEAIDIGFWRAVLGYSALALDNGFDPLGHGSTVWMQDLDAAKPLRHAMHIDVTVAREHAEARLAAALAAGGRMVDASNAPGSWILADRSGNKVCLTAWQDGAPTPGWTEEAGRPPTDASVRMDP